MKIEPFTRVDDTSFSATPQQIEAAWGAPHKRSRNVVQLDELDYGEVVFRFQDGGRLEEITRLAPIVFIGDEAILFPSLAGFIRTNDPSAFERAGFVVSPRYGLAFDPHCPSWVTALAEHCIDSWRSL
jgi:hypothetical protein